VGIFVDDQDRAEQFYTEVLGLRVKTNAAYGPGERWLTVVPPEEPDGVELVLHQTDDAARVFREASRELGRPVLSQHTDDCAAEAERLKAKGVVFVKEPYRKDYRGLDAVFADSPTPVATCSTSTRTERRNRDAAHPPTQPLIIGRTDPHTGKRSRDRFGLDRITGTSHWTDFAVPAASRGRVRR
jgi:catechol 2,3-dioxygenase-like lactoylglutathione lyase family enzyme